MARIYSNGSDFNPIGMMSMGATNFGTGTGLAQQVSICQSAAMAAARNSPAAPGLFEKCADARADAIASGVLRLDAMPFDPATRVELVEHGQHIIATDPRLATIFASTPVDQQNGFAIGVSVQSAVNAGSADAGYAAGVRLGMSSGYAAGFDKGMTAAHPAQLTKGAAPASADTILGMSTPVAIGVGVGVLGAAALVAWKLTR